MKIDLKQVEEAAKELYIRALKRLPPDVKQGFDALAAGETDAGAQRMLGTMIANIKVAEDTDNLLCQDTGIPIYNVWIGRNVEVDGVALKQAIRAGCARSTREYSFRSSIVHPTTRVNAQDSTGRGIPVIHEATPLGIAFSVVVVAIAAFNLVLDFDFIERGAESGAPKFMEWFGAFGLMVTLIWLYLEILRLLGKTRRR